MTAPDNENPVSCVCPALLYFTGSDRVKRMAELRRGGQVSAQASSHLEPCTRSNFLPLVPPAAEKLSLCSLGIQVDVNFSQTHSCKQLQVFKARGVFDISSLGISYSMY